MQYVKEFNGYVGDVPKFVFRRCDGKRYLFDELTQATVTPNVQSTEITAGWSLYPVCYLPAASTFEMQLTSGKFDADLFAMTNNVEFADNAAYEMNGVEHKARAMGDTAGKIVLDRAPAAGADKIYVAGMEEVDADVTLTTGHFKRDSSDTDGKTLLFYTGDSSQTPAIPADVLPGQEVEIFYNYNVAAREAQIDNRSSAMGECIFTYPVYGGTADCVSESAIVGHVIMKVYRARVTAQPGMDGSYKTGSTYQFTLSAVDPKRDDGKVYSIAYVKGATL